MAAGTPPVPPALHADRLVLAEPGRAVVRRADAEEARRGVHRSVQALERDIRAWIAAWNDRPQALRLDQDRRRDPRQSRRLLPDESPTQVTSRAWSGSYRCGYVAVAGGAGAGPDGEECLQFADDLVEAQAGAVSFGARASRCRVQKAWAAETRVTWWCQPFQVRPSKWARPRACFISR